MRLVPGKIYKSNFVLTERFFISFDVFPISFHDEKYSNIISFMDNGNSQYRGKLGDRIPAIFFHILGKSTGTETARSLHIAMTLNGKKEKFDSQKWYAVDKWCHIEIKQTLSVSKYFFEVTVNGERIVYVKNLKPMIYENVNVYNYKPWRNSELTLPLDGYIKNLQVESGKAIWKKSSLKVTVGITFRQ